jgi:hypothetical protein
LTFDFAGLRALLAFHSSRAALPATMLTASPFHHWILFHFPLQLHFTSHFKFKATRAQFCPFYRSSTMESNLQSPHNHQSKLLQSP